ncbi:MAG TPA: hypothetical protein VLA49_11600 [Anaerolineales bacterium]|nr:hypothetical protein [Anaerolineales bacterium]
MSQGNFMAEEAHHRPEQTASCGCFITPQHFLVVAKELGMDGNFAEISLLTCSLCGQQWLRYFYEVEAFTASGRWYLGAINAEQTLFLTAENAKAVLESLSWYFYGGSYYGGRSGKALGAIYLHP